MSCLALVGSRSTRRTGSRLAGKGFAGFCTGAGDSAELIQVLWRDILSVHWAWAATHCGSGLGEGCDASTIRQHLRLF